MGNLSGRLDDFADLAYLRNLKSKAAPEIPEILRSRIIQKGPGLSLKFIHRNAFSKQSYFLAVPHKMSKEISNIAQNQNTQKTKFGLEGYGGLAE